MQPLLVMRADFRRAIGAQDSVSAPVRHFQGQTCALVVATPINGQWLVAHLPTVAIGAVEQAGPVELPKTGLPWQLIHHPSRQEQLARMKAAAVTRRHHKAVVCPRCIDNPVFVNADGWVRSELLTRNGTQFRRGDTVTTQEAVQGMRYRVTGLAVVEQQDRPSTPAQNERGIQTGRPPAHNDNVPEVDLF